MDLQCPVCLFAVQSAHICRTCQNVFCRSCLQERFLLNINFYQNVKGVFSTKIKQSWTNIIKRQMIPVIKWFRIHFRWQIFRGILKFTFSEITHFLKITQSMPESKVLDFNFSEEYILRLFEVRMWKKVKFRSLITITIFQGLYGSFKVKIFFIERSQIICQNEPVDVSFKTI